jgi:pyruvate formate lyase activating enzyme
MKQCYLYEKRDCLKVKCAACSHRCIIDDGKRGICGVRKNIKGELYSLVYDKVLGLAVDPVEKKPLFHFMPGSSILSFGTPGCNFRCMFCQNYDMSQSPRESGEKGISGESISPKEIVDYAIKNKIPCIAYTYNEPAVFIELAYDTAKLAHKAGLKNVYVTNGYETKEALELMKPYIDAMNIDLKSFSDEFYKRVCGARLQPVLDTIKLSHEMGFWIEITTLIIPGENDSKKELTQIAEFVASVDKNMPWHVSRFRPMYKMLDKPITPEKTLMEAYEIGKKAGLKYVYVGNILTKDKENTYCPKCNELLVDRKAFSVVDNKIKVIKDKKKDAKSNKQNKSIAKCPICDEYIAGIF